MMIQIPVTEGIRAFQGTKKNGKWIVQWDADKVFIMSSTSLGIREISSRLGYVGEKLPEQLFKPSQLIGFDPDSTVIIETPTAHRIANYLEIRAVIECKGFSICLIE